MVNRSSKTETICEMCGQPTPSLVKANIEGATLRVCRNCSQYGTVIHEKQKTQAPTRAKTGRKTQQRTIAKSRPLKQKRTERPQKTLKEKYTTLIRDARRKKKWSQEKFANAIRVSISETQAIEVGRLVPTDEIVAKIERELDIDLMEEIMDIEITRTSAPSRGTTFGDIVIIKKDEKKPK